MGMIIDYRPTKSLFTDRENHQYAEDKNITRLICDDNPTISDVICKLLFSDKDLTKKEYKYLVTLFNIILNKKVNSVNKKVVIDFISKRTDMSTRTFERYTSKLIKYGILTVDKDILSFTKYYNPINIKYPTTDFIVLEINPNKTSSKIEL